MACDFCENFNWKKSSALIYKNEEGGKVAEILTHNSYDFPPESQLRFCPCCGAKNPGAPKEYYVTLKVHGEYTVKVEAKNWEEAQELARDSYYEADFGALQDFKMDFHSYWAEDEEEEVYL